MQRERHLAGLIFFVILATAATLHAWGLTDKPFGFRLQITDDHTFNYFPAATQPFR